MLNAEVERGAPGSSEVRAVLPGRIAVSTKMIISLYWVARVGVPHEWQPNVEFALHVAVIGVTCQISVGILRRARNRITVMCRWIRAHVAIEGLLSIRVGRK